MGKKYAATTKCRLCSRPAHVRHLCASHYQMAFKAGKHLAHPTVTARESFEAKIEKTDGCWLWKGAVNHYGYGLVSVIGHHGKTRRAHRVAYEYATGQPIPDGYIILHLCDNPPCVRPDHLRLGVARDNSQDMMKKGRGGGQFKPKLSDDDVRKIRQLRPTHKMHELAKMFGVGKSQICNICNGRSRSDVV